MLYEVAGSTVKYTGGKWGGPAIFWYEEIGHCESVFIGTSGTKTFLFIFKK